MTLIEVNIIINQLDALLEYHRQAATKRNPFLIEYTQGRVNALLTVAASLDVISLEIHDLLKDIAMDWYNFCDKKVAA